MSVDATNFRKWKSVASCSAWQREYGVTLQPRQARVTVLATRLYPPLDSPKPAGAGRETTNPSDHDLLFPPCGAARARPVASRCRRPRGQPALLRRLRAHPADRRARSFVWKPARPCRWHRLRAMSAAAPPGPGSHRDRSPLRARPRRTPDCPRRLASVRDGRRLNWRSPWIP